VPRQRENTRLLATLGALLAIITAIVVWQTHQLIVRPWVIGAVVVPWIASSVALRLNQDTIGFEGRYVDWWSIPHFVGGVLFALFGIRLVFVIAIATVWEVVEICAHTREYPTNRITDIVLAAAGWVTATLLAGASCNVL
jgi:hypothetical protein